MREKRGGRRSEPSAKRGEETGRQKRPGLEPGSQRVSLAQGPFPRAVRGGSGLQLCVLAGQDPAAFLRSRQPWAALITRPLIRPQPSPHGPAWCSCWQTELETKRVSKSLGCLAKAGSRRALS